ncbi:MAG: hypothetical protein V4616_10110 [Bacteroidota bacterium]
MKTLSLFLFFIGCLTQLSFGQMADPNVPTVATICGVQYGKLNPDQIIAEGRLAASTDNMQVSSFTMTVFNQRGIESYSSNSDRLTPQMIASLTNTKDGEAIRFSQVLLSSKDGSRMMRIKDHVNITLSR